jgi:MerR family transcriptional regulator, copper efflux regulator
MMTIGKLADLAGCNTASVRYYEDIKLLRRADRREGGHRTYGAEDVHRLTFIRRCRDFGFSIPEIRELIDVSGGAPCSEALDITKKRLAAVRSKISELRLLEQSLAKFADRCAQSCCGGAAKDCSLFDDLAS